MACCFAIRFATRGAIDIDSRRAHSVAPDVQVGRALRSETQRCAGRCTPPFDAHLALGRSADLDSARVEDAGICWSSKAQKCGGKSNCSNRSKEGSHVRSPESRYKPLICVDSRGVDRFRPTRKTEAVLGRATEDKIHRQFVPVVAEINERKQRRPERAVFQDKHFTP